MLISANHKSYHEVTLLHVFHFCFWMGSVSALYFNSTSFPFFLQESKSWWMPNAVSSFNLGLQLLRCQIQVFSRMLFGVIMIAAIAFLLIQRSSSSHQTMPVTVILLLLGVGCGYAGKFCIDTLGGSGNHWLVYWEALCLLHFFSNIFHSTLYIILNGPIIVAERVDCNSVIPYWLRKSLFYSALLFLPLLCGFMPFAGPWEWCRHFSSLATDFQDIWRWLISVPE